MSVFYPFYVFFCFRLQIYHHSHTPAIPIFEDFCAANALTILRIFCGNYATFSAWQKKEVQFFDCTSFF